jgi:hypothetical protein
MKRHLFVACLSGAALLAVLAPALPGFAETEAPAAAPAVPYPDGFRQWQHVKTGLVTAQSPAFAVAGGFHHIYANGPALAGYASGNFADGAVIVFDRLAVEEGAGGTLKEGQRIVVDVMLRDAAKFAATGGWGFEEFAGSSTTQRNVGAKAKATCFNCHAKQKPDNFVVSKLRE